MSADANQGTGVTPARAAESLGECKPSPAELLLEQYKLLEERRKYFGSQFMETIGGVGVMFTVLVGLLGGKPDNETLLRAAFVIGGLAFVLLAYLGHRLGKRQNDSEAAMSEIEAFLSSMGYTMIARMPGGAKKAGARNMIVVFLVLLGVTLVVVGLRGW